MSGRTRCWPASWYGSSNKVAGAAPLPPVDRPALDRTDARCFIDAAIPGAEWAATEVPGDRDGGDEMVLTHSDAIEVKRVRGKGRGIFARRLLRRGAVIERVPVLVLAVEELRDARSWDGLAGYCFLWSRGSLALALGYGSLYNHSYRPNARYDDEEGRIMVFTALRDIGRGEEITVNYNGAPGDETPVGFDVVECPNSLGREGSLPILRASLPRSQVVRR
jgi:hypothetical protein